MLQFFRKYQKGFFIVTAFFVVISFTFFGVGNAARNLGSTKSDTVIGRAIDGSKMSGNEMSAMTRFLALESSDLPVCNPCNDGVISHDFLEGELGLTLIESYFSELEGELTKKFERQKLYKTYVHPQTNLVSTKALWDQMLPELSSKLSAYQSREKMDVEGAKALIDLCNEQSHFPAHILYNMLRYQEGQVQGASKDPNLGVGEVTLFGAHNLGDILGAKFIELVAQTIHNGAIEAKKQGISVSKREARDELLRLGSEAISWRKLEGSVHDHIRHLGLDEASAVNVWQKVMLFRRLMEDKANSVIVDPLTYKKLHAFAGQAATLDYYEFSDELNDVEYLESYVAAVSNETSSILPKTFLPWGKVDPKFVEKRYLVDIKEVTLDEVALGVGIKEMWEWQEKNKTLIKNKGIKKEEVDSFARAEMAKNRKDLIEAALEGAKLERRVISTALDEQNELRRLLDKAPLPSDLEASKESKEVAKKLLNFSADGKKFVRVSLVDRSSAPEILTYAEAKTRSLLEKSEGGKKRLNKELEKALSELKANRYEVAKEKAPAMSERLSVKAPLADQWKLHKKEKRFSRKHPLPNITEDVLTQEVGSWEKLGSAVYQIASHKSDEASLEQEMQKGQEALGREVKKEAFKELVTAMQEKEAVHLTHAP